MSQKLLREAILFLKAVQKYAAAPEFVNLQNDPRAKLWFGDQMAEANNDKYFAILDRDNLNAIKALSDEGLFYVSKEELPVWYLQNEKTQETMRFIVDRYNRYFPQLDGNTVLSYLRDYGDLDPDSGASSNNPIFILVHDLIHQALQSQFVQRLHENREREDQGLLVPLVDELYEDIASSLSNFQPGIKNIGQGVFSYLANTFNKKWVTQVPTDDTLRSTIEATFHQVKAELRGKIDGLSNKHEISNTKVPNQIKQLVDGILSKAKYQMLQQVPDVVTQAVARNITIAQSIFKLFDLREIQQQYYERLMASSIVDQTNSSALRAWMLECLQAMKNLNKYFRYDFEEEFHESVAEEEEDE
jgi:hypothetical protein